MNGKLLCVSVGTSYGELSVNALNALKASRVIIAPRTKNAPSRALGLVSSFIDKNHDIFEVVFPMALGSNDAAYKEVIDIAKRHIFGENPCDISYLCIGDSMIYGSVRKLLALAKKEDIPCTVIAGVPSFCSMAAHLQESLCNDTQDLHIISGDNAYESGSLSNMIQAGNATFAILKCPKYQEEIVRLLCKNDYKVQVGFDIGSKKEMYISDSEKLCALSQKEKYFSLIIASRDS